MWSVVRLVFLLSILGKFAGLAFILVSQSKTANYWEASCEHRPDVSIRGTYHLRERSPLHPPKGQKSVVYVRGLA
ncbi:hypothetical protein BDV11DRAFT_70835 [Aspergillus similis]